MTKLAQHYLSEQTGISYTLSTDGYYLPDPALPEEPHYDIGRFGLMRRNYLEPPQQARKKRKGGLTKARKK